MAPSIVSGHTTVIDSADTTSRSIDVPTHSENDIIYIVFAFDSPNAAISVSGFSHLDAGGDLDTTSLTGAVLSKTAGASEGDTYAIVTDISERGAGIAFAVTNHGGQDATIVTQDGSGTTATFPAITPGVTDTLCIRALIADRDPYPIGSMTNYTDLDEVGVVASGATAAVFYRTLSSASEESSGTASLDQAEEWITATWTVAPASGTAYVRVIDETEAASEGSLRPRVLARLIAESVATSEAVARVIAFVRAIAETLAISEASQRLTAMSRAIGDTVALTETSARFRGLLRSIADTVAVTEATQRLQAMTRAIGETVAVTEATARARTLVRILAESEALTEATARIRTLIRTLSDGMTITEAAQASRAMLRAVAETVAISETAANARGFVRIVADTVATSEAVSRILGAVRVISETAAISEATARFRTLVRVATETIGIAEGVVRELSSIAGSALVRVVDESLSLVEALLKFRSIKILKSALGFVTKRKSVDIE